MNTFPLKLVFNDISKNNIIIDLEEDNFIHTTIPPEINNYNLIDKYLAYIYSKTDIKDVMSNLLEEGSSSITYSYLLQPVIKEEIFRKLLHSFFVKHNFYVKFSNLGSNPSKKSKIIGDFEIVITERDINHTFIQKWINNLLENDNYSETENEEVNTIKIISDDNSNIDTEKDDDKEDHVKTETDDEDEDVKTETNDDEDEDDNTETDDDDDDDDNTETGEDEDVKTESEDDEDVKTETEEDDEDVKTESDDDDE